MLGKLFLSLNESKNSQLFLGWHRPSDPPPPPPNKFRTNHTCLPTPCFARTVLNMQQYFHNHRSLQIIFTSGIGPDILMNVLEDCIILLVWGAWVLLPW